MAQCPETNAEAYHKEKPLTTTTRVQRILIRKVETKRKEELNQPEIKKRTE